MSKSTDQDLFQAASMSLWQGRVDDEELSPSLRWHQVVQDYSVKCDGRHFDISISGFACDEGVKRNKGRPGAKEGPDAIRKALANIAWQEPSSASGSSQSIGDAGNIICEGDDLEGAQAALANHVEALLNHSPNTTAVILGGGHEIAFGSYCGIHQHLQKKFGDNPPNLGIINFDAHLDLRNPNPVASSGTPFRQIAELCASSAQAQSFNYCVIGVNPTANTAGLIDFAQQHKVTVIEDRHCHFGKIENIQQQLDCFLRPLDYLYLTVCLDVFPAAHAPGVSAPAALGVEPAFALYLIDTIRKLCDQHNVRLILADIAEMSPVFDEGGRTAQLAARVVHEIVS